MKIVLTGGGSGGHFYPLIAVAESLNAQARIQKLADVELYYLAPEPYDEKALFENSIIFRRVPAGKIRRYFSLKNFFDLFKTIYGIWTALQILYRIYPDVIFGKGGYGSFPVVLAGRILGIPIVIHESDSFPGRVNAWAGHFARKIAISYPEAAQYFPKDRVAYTGNPIRRALLTPVRQGAYEVLGLNDKLPVVFVLGGSQGAVMLNDTLLDALPLLITKYQILHQVGPSNAKIVKETADIILERSQDKERYKLYDHLSILNMRLAAGVSDIIVSRAGSTLFEIAAWGKASIIIPIPEILSKHQVKNAFSYAASGAAVVIEQANLTSNILVAEINRIMENPEQKTAMETAARGFARVDAADEIAKALIDIGLEHEK